jgi:diguanylate cyclase (GGDEF)-like protein/PAS domain S-box-containing protein
MRQALTAIDAWLDDAIGAGGLDPDARANLMREQIKAVLQIAPAGMFASLATAIVIVLVSIGEPIFPVVLVWGIAVAALVGSSVFRFIRAGRRGVSRPFGRVLVVRLSLNAAAYGVLWGIIPIVALPEAHSASRLAIFAAIAGVTYVLGFSLAVVPQAALAFILPVAAGLAVAMPAVSFTAEGLVFVAVLAVCAVAIGAIAFRWVRHFVKRIALEAEVRGQQDIISLLLKEFEASGSDWLWAFDLNGTIVAPSKRFAAMSRLDRAALEGMPFLDYLRSIGGDNDPVILEIEQRVQAHEAFSDLQIKLAREDGEHWWRITGKPSEDEFGSYSGYIGTAADITAEKLAEKRVSFLAHNDALTGLLNRAKFTEQLKLSVARLERYGSPFAIMFLDLDQFKLVNDSRGHLIGDRLLVEVARRIRAAIRETDIAARLGGDEFAIILNHNCSPEDTAALGSRLVRAVGEAYEFDDEIVSIGVSIGIAMAPVNGIRPDQLLRNADLALYRAKAEGRGVFRFFESQMDSDVREKRILELELREALRDGEFVLYYQPLVSAETKEPTGFEALVRWNHPIRGVVPPAEFIPIAEQTGLIKQIGDWTIREACNAAARWPNDLVVAVNLSPKHFQLSDIPQVVSEALRESGLSPHRLELEITESLLIERPDHVVEKLTELKSLGVTIAMDDFGTGYSSLSYLMKFPFDKIKIDKSFVTASSEDTVARDILRTIASLGRTLKIGITAEGVETSEQVEFLRDIACHHLQGFFFAKPLNEQDLAAYFLRHFEEMRLDIADEAEPVRLAG